MLKNYIKIAFRNLLRFKVYTLINLVGLSMGLTVAVLILLFVMDEISFDKFHTKADRIYKVTTANPEGGDMEANAWPIAHKLKTEFPEVEAVLYAKNAFWSKLMVNYEGKRYEHDTFYAGEDFFKIFSFDLIEGNPETALKNPFSIVITEEIRDRYFGADLVLGKTMTLRDSLEFTITGVIEEIPSQSHIQFEMLTSFSTFGKLSWFSYSEGWGNFNVMNYVLLKEGTDINSVKAKASGLYIENVGDWLEEMGVEFTVEFTPLSDIYLKSDFGNSFGPQGSMDRVYLVSAIALFVILLACINFVNLTTARSIYRAKEVGLRKVAGSTRIALFWQFLIEAFILTFIAFVSIIILIDFTLPLFNELMGKSYEINSLFTVNVSLGLLTMFVLVSILAGFYPAIVLSGYRPVDVLKGRMESSAKGVKLRRVLVIFQFLISGGLVLATLIVVDQLSFMRNQDLGFDKEQVLVLDATRVPRSAAHGAFKNAIRTLSSVEDVSYANALPGRPGWLGQWAYAESMEDGAEQIDTEYMAIDERYISTLGLKLIAGKNFDLDRPSELEEGLIINEKTVKEMGWQTPENAIGRKIVSPSKRPAGTVIGVVKDYHGLGLQEEIWAKAMDYASNTHGRYYAIRFTTGQTSNLIDEMKVLWENNLGDYTFEYFFLDQDFDRQYRAEDRLMSTFVVFAIITMIIASIGLLGLVSFMVLSRTKEIGIRKVLGADVLNLARLLSKEFVLLVIIANLITIPIIWFLGEKWLEDFAYRMEINPMIFLMSLCITLVIAIATVSMQTIKAARQNPVDTLRDQ